MPNTYTLKGVTYTIDPIENTCANCPVPASRRIHYGATDMDCREKQARGAKVMAALFAATGKTFPANLTCPHQLISPEGVRQ